MEFLTGGRQNGQTIHNALKLYKDILSLPNNTVLKVIKKDDIIFYYKEKNKMSEKKERCKYCVEYNGDCVEESDGFDYFSCELKNKEDLEKYGKYSSFDNRVDEDECTHYLCESCLFRKENKG